jgi:hypothetical protein
MLENGTLLRLQAAGTLPLATNRFYPPTMDLFIGATMAQITQTLSTEEGFVQVPA